MAAKICLASLIRLFCGGSGVPILQADSAPLNPYISGMKLLRVLLQRLASVAFITCSKLSFVAWARARHQLVSCPPTVWACLALQIRVGNHFYLTGVVCGNMVIATYIEAGIITAVASPIPRLYF
jgi:hypothetical protein